MGELRMLFKNKSYVLLAITFSLIYAVYTSLSTVVNNISAPYGYSSTNAALIGMTFIVSGVIGTLIFSKILDRTKSFLMVMRILASGTLVAGCLAFVCLPTGKLSIFLVNIALLGMFLIPIFSISYTFSVELTYPVGESVSSGVMVFTS